ncbi:diaminohydroxyphosphoribosylaminopyrimidine deaminase / 5-amino-6-(5-phosphoribosylamino)uracil reductase [Raineyella antarctica]|uniref:Riboflavin biosynthesis protein RibD n=1 Tax=Raineyella antarctica TaxID=1577474 RepID=A0A1G6HAP1_9ACTN|nr:bifunctional diaminohydroxyphosphoribosylaminopyrimidine deaminase/5-amino-6-(5-phosphoribosylamino)uracil reductase RibD [Raineyella antarctica]SDB91148.1 diaminohydroxyphosphoribosylaminopyrimidine deaminase / 5-amino-6-(5-phosphoribosylamino)uracil reductase [Raineyella antarctica]
MDQRNAAHTHVRPDGPGTTVPVGVEDPAVATDREYLRRAIALATLSPLPDPNPRVGAVLVSPTGTVVGEGWHHGAGTPHAEVEALRAAGAAARGATAYVSLEPCNHTGRTGPCATALVEAGVARVVYAQPDPNPAAAGGATTLRAAGVEVLGGLLAEEAEEVNRIWTRAVRLGRPWVTWKVAATIDGHTAAADGSSQWITCPEARADVHHRRALCDAIVVGTGTALADDPRLTVRHADGTLAERQPLRVVVGDRQVPPDARLRSDEAETLFLPGGDPRRALAELDRVGVRHAWLEGGATLAAAFLREGLVDEVLVYQAPALLGSGLPLVGDLGVRTLADALKFTITDVGLVGTDVRITMAPATKEA